MLSPSPVKDVVVITPGSHVSMGDRNLPSPGVRKLLMWSAIAAGLLALVTLFLTLPVQFPSVVSSYADITAANTWVLEKGSSGQLLARTFNYQTGMSDGYRVSNFDGGSSIFFALAPTLKPGRHVAVGDTVGTVSSSEIQERLVTLNGQLEAAERSLAVNATGAKAAVIEAAQERLESAKRRREDYQATVERTQALFKDHLVPQGEYDRVLSAAHALDDAILIQQADLQTSLSGAKPEELALSEARIAALKNEIAALYSQAAAYTIRSPIEGTVSSSSSGDMLITISATSPYIAIIPVRYSDYARVAATPNARVTVLGFTRRVQGRILSMNHSVESRAGQRVVMATALLDSPPDDLLPGSLARCRIECTPLTAKEYGKFLLKSIASSVDAAGSF